MRRVKIVSDGTRVGTRVEDAETGEELRGIVRVDWHVVADERRAQAEITFRDVEVDVIGQIPLEDEP